METAFLRCAHHRSVSASQPHNLTTLKPHNLTNLTNLTNMKVYSKRELAMLYFPGVTPKAATNRLAGWIKRSEELSRQLAEAGYKPANKLFTVRQLKIIFAYLGEP